MIRNEIGIQVSRIFPTSVYTVDCSFLLESVEKVLNQYKDKDEKWTISLRNRSTLSKEVLNDHLEVKEYIETVVNGCLQEWKYELPLKMSSSWFTRTSKGRSIDSHFHCNSLWSAVFYFEDSSSLVLLSDNVPAIYIKSKAPANVLSYGSVEMAAKKGSMIIFPSSLSHASKKNKLNEDRYSLAMNFMPFGKIKHSDSAYDYR